MTQLTTWFVPAFRAIKVKALTTGLAGGSVKNLSVLTTFPKSFPGLLLNYFLKQNGY